MKKEKKTPETVEEEVVETAEQKLQKELDEKNEQFLRLCAEYDNFRKRSQKEKQDIYTSSQAEIVKELLPVLDNFDRAAENKECSFEDYKKGIDLIFTQLGEILKKLGIEAYGARGDEFDPNIHNAVMTVEDPELGENQVASVFSKGYKLGDRVIREAVVQVANS
ncbi:MAG: nucleotide exchange factor GrpE [Acutalibacteraceae bacterium]|nr:nucleotide exchange factor GrpE [Acutalibacteraceae bacterium]